MSDRIFWEQVNTGTVDLRQISLAQYNTAEPRPGDCMVLPAAADFAALEERIVEGLSRRILAAARKPDQEKSPSSQTIFENPLPRPFLFGKIDALLAVEGLHLAIVLPRSIERRARERKPPYSTQLHRNGDLGPWVASFALSPIVEGYASGGYDRVPVRLAVVTRYTAAQPGSVADGLVGRTFALPPHSGLRRAKELPTFWNDTSEAAPLQAALAVLRWLRPRPD